MNLVPKTEELNAIGWSDKNDGRCGEVHALVSEGATILDQVQDFLGRFVAYPSNAAKAAHALWIVHAHMMGAWDSTPRLAFLSPEPGSGKSRALEITELLVPRPILTVNATPAFVFRRVSDESGLPTILADEIDTVFGPKARENEELRGFYNAGHRRGAVAGRCVKIKNAIETEELPAYCAVAFAGLGNLPDTILTRSIIIKMRRRAPGEKVEPYRRRIHEASGHHLRDKVGAWASNVASIAENAFPDLPEGIVDRVADVWEPLIIIADLAGGDWPARARSAAKELVAASKGNQGSLGIKLLSDTQVAFEGEDRLPSTRLLEKLVSMEESPWGDFRGKPLDARGLSKILKQYDIQPSTIRLGSVTAKGYFRAHFDDAWARYLPVPVLGSVTSVTFQASAKINCARCAGIGCNWCELTT